MYWQFCGSFSTINSALGGVPHGANPVDVEDVIAELLSAVICTQGTDRNKLKSNAQHSVFVMVNCADAGEPSVVEWNGTKPPEPPAIVKLGQSGSGGGRGTEAGRQSSIAGAASGTVVSENQLSSGIGKMHGTSHFSTSKTGF